MLNRQSCYRARQAFGFAFLIAAVVFMTAMVPAALSDLSGDAGVIGSSVSSRGAFWVVACVSGICMGVFFTGFSIVELLIGLSDIEASKIQLLKHPERRRNYPGKKDGVHFRFGDDK